MIQYNGINKIIRCFSLITTLLYSLQLIAAPEDHGRWYSLDESSSSSHSPAFYIFCFIMGTIIGIFGIVMTLKDNRSNSDKGCIIIFIIALIIAGFFSLQYLCS